MPCLVRGGPVRLGENSELLLPYRHAEQGSGTWRLDEQTLRPVGSIVTRPSRPAALNRVESQFPGMRVKWAGDLGRSGTEGLTFMLRWETLGSNRDRPRQPPFPDPSVLRVHAIRIRP